MLNSNPLKHLKPAIGEIAKQQAKMIKSQEGVLNVIEQMGQQQKKLIENQTLTVQNQSDLAVTMQQLMTTQMELTQVVKEISEQLTSTKAAVDRLDCIMDYLLRQDKSSHSDSSES